MTMLTCRRVAGVPTSTAERFVAVMADQVPQDGEAEIIVRGLRAAVRRGTQA